MVEEELKGLHRSRGGIKHKLTNLINFINNIKSKLQDNKTIEPVQLADLKFRIDIANNLYDEFETVQGKIECICNDLDVEKEYEERSAFFNSFSAILAVGRTILNNTSENDNVSEKSCHSNSSQLNNANIFNGVKLPTISLPKFNGDYNSWLEFKDTFESLIHLNETISHIQKFHYLRASLESDASKIIQSLEFTSGNYTTAWGLLCTRYNNSKLLVHNHIKAIFELEQLNKESSTSLRQLIDNIYKHLRALENLKQPIEHWDALLIFIITSKLDKTTAREWEKIKLATEQLSLTHLKDFLQSRADLLETLEINHGIKAKDNTIRSGNKKYSLVAANSQKHCNYCRGNHLIYACSSFLQLSVPERKEKVRHLKLCENCLCTNHFAFKCKSFPCKFCKKKHSNLLHQDEVISKDEPQPGPSTITSTVMSSRNDLNAVLLSTAKLVAYDSRNSSHVIRAVLDSGSQSNFISEQLCKKLALKKVSVDISVVGINTLSSTLKYKCQLKIKSICSSYSASLTCYILPQITGSIPIQSIDVQSWNIPSNIKLADESFYETSDIDLLIGASHFWNLLKPARISLGKHLPVLQDTVLGWVVAGPLLASSSTVQCHFSKLKVVDELKKFWETEEVPSIESTLSPDDADCEQYFLNSLSRSPEGKFIVRIPLKFPPSNLGESKVVALKRMLNLEKRLQSDPLLKTEYVKFMNEYIDLGHMSQNSNVQCNDMNYYLPHHGVIKKDSLTTKLRVVFNGSSPSSSGWSVNDLQHIGPPIYNELFTILLQFRQHSVAVCSDIEKMYRQILIHPDDRYLQNIVWRPDSSSKINSYSLNTVTYGTSSAPYLAVRCIKQLAKECKKDYPEASRVIENNFYVDDLIASFPTEEIAVGVCNDINVILKSASFNLRKWVSNKSDVVKHFKSDLDPISTVTFNGENRIKTLGMIWNNVTDKFAFHVEPVELSKITKRRILSDLAKIFDPLGLCSPCIIVAKIIVQKLWTAQLNWDDAIPKELENKWIQFSEHLKLINNIEIPRQVACCNPVLFEMHGFSDSSASAYGACVYLKTVDSHEITTVRLLCAKTRVAPIKPVTIPRLELCAAVLLTKLINKVRESLQLKCNMHYWSDSQIILHWIRTPPGSLNTFVSNRVSIIQTLTNVNDWKYVNTKENPADLASRGVLPSALIKSSLWWNGPSWLTLSTLEWPEQPLKFSNVELPELKEHCLSLIEQWSFPFERFSKFNKIRRVMAYCLRFISNSRLSKQNRNFEPLSVSELDRSMKALVKFAQLTHFADEIYAIKNKGLLNLKNKLASLSPFLDSDGILRVGGRLKNSNLQFDAKHPILLNGKHILAKLIFEHTHTMLLHAGPQLVLATVRQTYWPTGGMNAAKKVVHNCVICFKAKPRSVFPIMAHLPQERVNIASAFNIVGVDYAGPVFLRDRRGRNYKTYKAYICLFICFASKAVHLELTTDLTSETFLATLRRFVSRRGKPSQIWSDNGTNFVGAQKLLSELFDFLKKSENDIIDFCASESITWKFIPPNSPHFGGLWECGVKNVKLHLNRVLKDTKLTFEELYTVLTQIEATLNSRPLYSLSSDPNDLLPLTPSHLLIGRPLVALPDVDLKHIPVNRLSRFQLLQSLHQHFWSRWSVEYLSVLQQRRKWKNPNENLKVGTMVLIKQDNLPPCHWIMGKIQEVHPDSAGIVRIASVRTNKGVFKRSATRLCPLPNACDEPNTEDLSDQYPFNHKQY